MNHSVMSMASDRLKPAFAVRSLVMICLSLSFVSSCGKRGAPIPPRERVQQRVELSGFQRGDTIILAWKTPPRNAPKGSVVHIKRADIYRLAEPVSSRPEMSEEEFSARATIIASLGLSEKDFGSREVIYRDKIELKGQSVRLRYAVRLVNDSGQKAAFSDLFIIEPSMKIADAPAELTATADQNAIILNWKAPERNIDGSPANLIGYNIYRSTSMKEPAKLLNAKPVPDTTFEDTFFEFDTNYFYFVRSVSVGLMSEPVESSESEVISFKAVDTFSPAAPSSLTVAAAPGVITIFFASNVERDVVGYNIYRSVDPGLPIGNWQKLTEKPVVETVFRDERVDSGKTYFYYVTAVDKFGNVSPASEIVSETAL